MKSPPSAVAAFNEAASNARALFAEVAIWAGQAIAAAEAAHALATVVCDSDDRNPQGDRGNG